MAKEKTAARGEYGEVVQRLTELVESLERGELSLEDSLERFQEGINLVKRGEHILSEADKRIEQLLSEDGKTVPLKLTEERPAVPPAAPARRPAPAAIAPAPADDDDVPF